MKHEPKLNDGGYSVGQRVRIKEGCYAGRLATILKTPDFEPMLYAVKMDGYENPLGYYERGLTPALKPCPLCGQIDGGEDIFTPPAENADVIRCHNCGGETKGHEPNTGGHIEAWNRGEVFKPTEVTYCRDCKGHCTHDDPVRPCSQCGEWIGHGAWQHRRPKWQRRCGLRRPVKSRTRVRPSPCSAPEFVA